MTKYHNTTRDRSFLQTINNSIEIRLETRLEMKNIILLYPLNILFYDLCAHYNALYVPEAALIFKHCFGLRLQTSRVA